MSDKNPATTNGDTKPRVRGPNKPKPPMDPVDLARHVYEQTKDWDAVSWGRYTRVLEALRGDV